MYTKDVIIKMIKKSRKLRKEKNMTIREIAKKLWVSKNSVNKWINLKFKDENNIKNEYEEKRWYKKWKYRKYDKVVWDRVENIYTQMIDEKRFFINEHTIYDNYISKYWTNESDHKVPTKRYIEYIQKVRKLHKKKQKLFRNWLSKYMNYPEKTIKKLWYISEWIDFVWPRNIAWDSTNYHFLSRRYDRPKKYWKFGIIQWQTTNETIKKLIEDRQWDRPVPDVMKIDNDSAYWMLNLWIHKSCIWKFTKRLLYLWIIPLYSAPRSPRNNWNVEWQNSVFNKMFWQEIFFNSASHLKTEIKRFNTEYEQYSDLIDTSKSDVEKLKIEFENIYQRVDKLKISLEKLKDFDNLISLKKEDFNCQKICILRKVIRKWDKWDESEMGIVKLLWNEFEISKDCINKIMFCEIDIQKDTLKIWEEIEWKLKNRITKEFKIKNI